MPTWIRPIACCVLALTLAVEVHAQAAAQTAVKPAATPSSESLPPERIAPARTVPATPAQTQPVPTQPVPTPPSAPAGGAVSVPLLVLNKTEAMEKLRPKTPEARIDLQQIRLVRTHDFGPPGELPGKVGVTTLSAEGATQDLFKPGMAFICRIATPDYCGLLDFRNARVTALTDQSGKPVRPAAVAGQPAAIGDSNVISWNRTNALIQFNTALPPRGDAYVGHFAAEVTADVGVLQPVQVTGLREKAGQLLLDHPDGTGLTVTLESIDDEKVVLVAEGAVKKLGPYTFAGVNGEALEPYANTVEVQAVQPDGHPRQTTTLAFSTLPQILTLKINYYPKIESKKLQIAFDRTPLP